MHKSFKRSCGVESTAAAPAWAVIRREVTRGVVARLRGVGLTPSTTSFARIGGCFFQVGRKIMRLFLDFSREFVI
ncbi:unnamed protein product [Musa acuminata subsp. malaccensis]|uniref:(wild Malaysian banana) hypothetical protein n=1 Tax=Musa acuminata subsp. malaccensis TaxID=214687 RepID=A0A8D7AFE3_MUSAM|nr:unnamed protein product [Musa acuminata subsp. malaccensis]CAG1846991.1 unnamed protein product [Musa acuminata subsp. malaccensis]